MYYAALQLYFIVFSRLLHISILSVNSKFFWHTFLGQEIMFQEEPLFVMLWRDPAFPATRTRV